MLLLAGIGLTSGAPQFGPIGPAHGPLHHAPVHHDPYVKVPPRPFAYEYGVQVGHSSPHNNKHSWGFPAQICPL